MGVCVGGKGTQLRVCVGEGCPGSDVTIVVRFNIAWCQGGPYLDGVHHLGHGHGAPDTRWRVSRVVGPVSWDQKGGKVFGCRITPVKGAGLSVEIRGYVVDSLAALLLSRQ